MPLPSPAPAQVIKTVKGRSASGSRVLQGAAAHEGEGILPEEEQVIEAVSRAFSAVLREIKSFNQALSDETVAAGLSRASGHDIAQAQKQAYNLAGMLSPLTLAVIEGLHGIAREVSEARGSLALVRGEHYIPLMAGGELSI